MSDGRAGRTGDDGRDLDPAADAAHAPPSDATPSETTPSETAPSETARKEPDHEGPELEETTAPEAAAVDKARSENAARETALTENALSENAHSENIEAPSDAPEAAEENRPPRRLTQRELAERLGLSRATVSLALRDSPMIAEETRRLVREAMRATGYVPNRAAAALRTGRTRIVGVSFHNIAHQFFAQMLIAIEETLGAAGIAVFLNNHGEDGGRMARFVDSLAAHGSEGLLVSPPPNAARAAFAPIDRIGAPIVYVSRRLRDDAAADWVVNDDRMALRRATARLLELGHRRIALIGGQPGTTVAEERVAGFRAELEAAGLSWNDRFWRRCRPRLTEGAAAAKETLDWPERPTGLVCFNDLVAFGAMNALRSRGLEPGRDVAVVGVGGTDEAAAHHPALTTVLDNPSKIGRLAAEILLRRLAAPSAPAQHVVIDPKLMIRESCGGPIRR